MGNACSSSDTTAAHANQANGDATKVPDGAETEEPKAANKNTNGFPKTHDKCRNQVYPRTEDVNRFNVPDDKVSWSVSYPEYKAIEFFAVQEVPIEEDPDFRKADKPKVQWNTMDGHINRKSHQGKFEIVDKVPRNPVGRTGVRGRGRLGRWGPNHAADPIVTRWKRDDAGKVVKHAKSNKAILQFISIQRGDSGQWAIPGGFVDQGEEAIDALKREFCEETMDSNEATEEQKQDMKQKIEKLFSGGTEVYRGYVDDPRNTDDAWMETVAVNFHDESGQLVGKLALRAGDDAIGVKWLDVDSSLDLYASHVVFVQKVAELHGAAW